MKSKNRDVGSRREFIKKIAYVAPVILTLPAIPALASVGSTDNAGPSEVQMRCNDSPFRLIRNDCEPVE